MARSIIVRRNALLPAATTPERIHDLIAKDAACVGILRRRVEKEKRGEERSRNEAKLGREEKKGGKGMQQDSVHRATVFSSPNCGEEQMGKTVWFVGRMKKI